MDRSELLNDNEQALRLALDDRQSSMWTAMPAIIQAVDLDAMTCSVQLAIQGTVQDQTGTSQAVNYPLLEDVPICFPNAGGFSITFPMAIGDEVLVVFGSRCIDSWWQSGGYLNRPMEARMHDLSDAFAIPGPRSQPKVLESISSTDLQIRNEDGTVFLAVKANGKFTLKNSHTDLKTLLSDLESALNTFMTTLAGFSGGASPVTQAMIQAPAATAETALTNVLTEIGQLLA
jgi:hypothetical protein